MEVELVKRVREFFSFLCQRLRGYSVHCEVLFASIAASASPSIQHPSTTTISGTTLGGATTTAAIRRPSARRASPAANSLTTATAQGKECIGCLCAGLLACVQLPIHSVGCNKGISIRRGQIHAHLMVS